MWEPGFNGAVYRFKDEASLKKGMALLQKSGTKDDDVYKALNSESTPDAVIIQRNHFEFSRFKDAPQSAIVKGKPTEPIRNSDGSYTVVLADNVYNQPTQKTLDEARGYAVAEYQDALEKTWNASLRSKYPVKVEEQVFQSMVK
jgi:peptidyl-prolyl cis-trans isomerase SurA